ncbi:hypothetical protein EC844_12917 [Acinetobacter calcoaceticus]|uniref:Uncharacterized protein n=1 Tax=Acinetobacter calcoaceticus TaxID=471 RepID=A0A4R1XC08_ACICA|nr:hypothetical protein EC844_12917 [Acinetobacter calcoaceticus]
MLGGNNNYMYVPTPTTWVDALGLSSCPVLKAPNPRHYADKVTQKSTAKDKNTVINRKVVDINSDVNAIRSGLAAKIGNTFSLKNGRTYGEHDCILYPISGSGFYNLTRGEYKALDHFNVLGEQKGEDILNKAGYDKAVIEKGKEIWKIVK